MSTQRISELLARYEKGACTAAEKALVDQWFEQHGMGNSSFDKMDARQQQQWVDALFADIKAKNAGESQPAKRTIKLWPRIISVAAAVAAIAFGIWFFKANYLNGRHPEVVSGSPLANDIAPGKNTATLSLAGGKAITLSDAHNGVIINASQIKYNDGSLVQNPSGSYKEMTVTTPRGGTYQITLPDGTKVWLNAASSLTYHAPLNDGGGVREVELVGEAYFEVFRNKLQPFVVNSKKMELTVLGTHFNVNAYGDESSIKATLLEGSVRITSSGTARRDGVVLKPNQQALVTESAQISVKEVDVNQIISWKEGYFRFNNDKIEPIMQQLARWYDIEVSYEGKMPDDGFNGTVSRYKNISQVLKALQSTKLVHFKVEGRKVTVIN